MRGMRKLAGRQVVLVTGQVQVRGRVDAVTGGVVLLSEATALERTGDVKVDGSLMVPISRVEYVQVLP